MTYKIQNTNKYHHYDSKYNNSSFKILKFYSILGHSGKFPDGNTPNIITYRPGYKAAEPIAPGAREGESKRRKEGRKLAGRE